MKSIKKKTGMLCLILFLFSACGSIETGEGQEDSALRTGTAEDIGLNGIPGDMSAADEDGETQKGIVLHSDFLTRAGTVERTWEKNYDSAEWADKPCINILASGMVGSSNSRIYEVEEECNHYLDENGYAFQVHFVLSEIEEIFNGITLEEEMAKRESEGIVIDMYLLTDYRSAVQEGTLLKLNDYLAGEEGRSVYEYYDEALWDLLREDGENIYGIPRNPIAVKRRVYAYNPQLAEILNIDMAGFNGNMRELEPDFQSILEQDITPVCLDGSILEDKLLLSDFGLENFDNMLAIRHDGNEPVAVDLWEEPEVLQDYAYLGSLREKGYLAYSNSLMFAMDWIDTPIEEQMSEDRHLYTFLSIGYMDQSSWIYGVNFCEDGYLETEYCVPECAAYLYENINDPVLAIRECTVYPEECFSFASLLVTDDNLKRMLYCGIENYHYMWQDGKLIYDSGGSAFAVGLGLEYDRSFLSEEYHEKFTEQYRKMNADVQYAASYEVEFAFTGLEQEYADCKKIFEDNWLTFWGYYGDETERKLEEIHEALLSAGYDRLIDTVNASLQQEEQ